MRSTSHVHGIGCALLAAACVAAPTGKGPEDGAPIDGKADSFQDPTAHGTLVFGAPPQGAAFTESARFHEWRFELAAESEVTVRTHLDDAEPDLDTVLYVFKRGDDGDFGAYVAKNDDAGDGPHSEVQAVLGAGTYRVIVKAFKVTMHGAFEVSGACDGAGCAPSPATCPTVEELALPAETAYTAGCGRRVADILLSEASPPVRRVMAHTDRCTAGGVTGASIGYYLAYWIDGFGYDEMLEYAETLNVTETKTAQGTAVLVDMGGDEDELLFVYDDRDALLMFTHNEQSSQNRWFCQADGPEVEEPDPFCMSDFIRNAPHAATAARAETLSGPVEELLQVTPGAAAHVLRTYQQAHWLPEHVTLDAEVESWGEGEYERDAFARVTVSQAGAERETFHVSGDFREGRLWTLEGESGHDLRCVDYSAGEPLVGYLEELAMKHSLDALCADAHCAGDYEYRMEAIACTGTYRCTLTFRVFPHVLAGSGFTATMLEGLTPDQKRWQGELTTGRYARYAATILGMVEHTPSTAPHQLRAECELDAYYAGKRELMTREGDTLRHSDRLATELLTCVEGLENHLLTQF